MSGSVSSPLAEKSLALCISIIYIRMILSYLQFTSVEDDRTQSTAKAFAEGFFGQKQNIQFKNVDIIDKLLLVRTIISQLKPYLHF